jgi:hypothetical protein
MLLGGKRVIIQCSVAGVQRAVGASIGGGAGGFRRMTEGSSWRGSGGMGGVEGGNGRNGFFGSTGNAGRIGEQACADGCLAEGEGCRIRRSAAGRGGSMVTAATGQAILPVVPQPHGAASASASGPKGRNGRLSGCVRTFVAHGRRVGEMGGPPTVKGECADGFRRPACVRSVEPAGEVWYHILASIEDR